jgi:hypothetical protein
MILEKKMDGKSKEVQWGTWFSVGIVGLVIFLTYLLLFGFYFARV